MNTTILLQGYLTKERLRAAENEMVRYVGGGDILLLPTLVITSEGGDAEETLAFLTRMKQQYGGFDAKIYRAESAAALIALSAMEREMVRDGIFTINLGSAEIDSGTLITPEKVPSHIIEQAKRFRNKVFEKLERLGVPKDGPLMNRILVQKQLTLTAEECFAAGLVHRII